MALSVENLGIYTQEVLTLMVLSTIYLIQVSCTNIGEDTKLTTSMYVSTENPKTSDEGISNISFPVPTVGRNTTYSLGPGRTILGLSVEVFSFVLLGIAGVAPVVFIVLVVVSMKCYTWRKRRRFQKYEERYRTGMELWEREKQFRLNGKFRGGYDGPQMLAVEEESTQVTQTGSVSFNPQDYPGLTASTSNPNVYFRETSLDGHEKENAKVGNGDISHNNGTAKANSRKSIKESSFRHSNSINSEERQALECFDKIYENMDVSTSSSENSNSSVVPLSKTKDGFRYQHPLYAKSSAVVLSDGDSHSQGSETVQVSNSDLQVTADIIRSPSTTSDHGSSQIESDTRALTRSDTSNSIELPGAEMKVRKPSDPDSLIKRQSWLYSAYTNVAYVPD